MIINYRNHKTKAKAPEKHPWLAIKGKFCGMKKNHN